MKKYLAAMGIIVMTIGMAGVAYALPYVEEFYGNGADGNYIDLFRGDSVTLAFNLKESAPANASANPTRDATGFNLDANSIQSAQLSFVFSSEDWRGELVLLEAGFPSGDSFSDWELYTLGGHGREYGSLLIDLAAVPAAMGNLQDGILETTISAPTWFRGNDIRLDSATLTVTGPSSSLGTVSVPEPATILMFGAGLIGLAGLGRRHFLRRRKDEESDGQL